MAIKLATKPPMVHGLSIDGETSEPLSQHLGGAKNRTSSPYHQDTRRQVQSCHPSFRLDSNTVSYRLMHASQYPVPLSVRTRGTGIVLSEKLPKSELKSFAS